MPGSPIPAKRSLSEGVERRLSTFLRLRPIFEWRRVRFFQVWREFDAMVGIN